VPLLRLRSVSGPRCGQEFVFPGPRVRIGRSRDNDLILPEQAAPLSSGHHAEALLDDGSWWIVDSGSSNGTHLNGAAVLRQRLTTGDRLIFGSDRFDVAIDPPDRSWWPIAAAIVIAALGLAGALAFFRRPRPSFEEVATRAARSVFAIAVEANGRRVVLGTAFAVAADGLLATNAHIADALGARGALAPPMAAQALAVQGDTYQARRIAGAAVHPGWQRNSVRNDVAVLRLAPGPALDPLPLSDRTTLAGLRRGAAVAAFGFPAVSTDPARPRGRLSVDVIGDVRGEYLQVGLGIAPGTSGSPVFGESGSVVAIVVGGDFVEVPGAAARPSGSAVNWALSAAVVEDFLASIVPSSSARTP
jgi:S1-C subfamily serine protease